MSNYRNIGYLNGSTGINIPVELNPKGQVYLATHDELGNKRTAIERSYISFSWGGRDIEDFNFLVVANGERYDKPAYSTFNDSVTEIDILDGQYFWRSKFAANNLNFYLATDGVSEKILQDFRNWFKPGIIRRLVLAEAPNRYINARISEVPNFSLIPFEEKTTINIGNTSYEVTTAKWRGELELSFVMDDPFWGSLNTLYLNNNLNDDELRVILEDGIPHKDMFNINNDNKVVLANKYLLTAIQNIESSIDVQTDATFDINKNNNSIYLYYCGTAAARPILSFDLLPEWAEVDPFGNSINDSSIIKNTYIINPYNSFMNNIPLEASIKDKYNYLAIGDKQFCFTTPSIFTAYNQLVKILFEDYAEGDSMIDVKKSIRGTLNDTYSRMWALSICELAMDDDWREIMDLCEENSRLKTDYNNKFLNYFKNMFYMKANPTAGNELELQPFKCTFNSKTGTAQMDYTINVLDMDKKNDIKNLNSEMNEGSNIENINITFTDLIRSEPITIKENIGDMIRSDYLIIGQRTLPNENNMITELECLKITSNCTLYNVSLDYNYMYL